MKGIPPMKNNLDVIMWPIFIIFIGVLMIFAVIFSGKHIDNREKIIDSQEIQNQLAIYKITSQNKEYIVSGSQITTYSNGFSSFEGINSLIINLGNSVVYLQGNIIIERVVN